SGSISHGLISHLDVTCIFCIGLWAVGFSLAKSFVRVFAYHRVRKAGDGIRAFRMPQSAYKIRINTILFSIGPQVSYGSGIGFYSRNIIQRIICIMMPKNAGKGAVCMINDDGYISSFGKGLLKRGVPMDVSVRGGRYDKKNRARFSGFFGMYDIHTQAPVERVAFCIFEITLFCSYLVVTFFFAYNVFVVMLYYLLYRTLRSLLVQFKENNIFCLGKTLRYKSLLICRPWLCKQDGGVQ